MGIRVVIHCHPDLLRQVAPRAIAVVKATGEQSTERHDGQQVVDAEPYHQQAAEEISPRLLQAAHLYPPPCQQCQIGQKKSIEFLRCGPPGGATPELPAATIPSPRIAPAGAETQPAFRAVLRLRRQHQLAGRAVAVMFLNSHEEVLRRQIVRPSLSSKQPQMMRMISMTCQIMKPPQVRN